jgi:hypothetical protein
LAVSITLDHAGILVPRLAEAAALLERLGFTLTRRAEHRAEGGASAGSAQCSLMLETGYVEVQEIADLASSTHILAPAARREGFAAEPWGEAIAVDLRGPLGCVLIAEDAGD